VSSATIPTSLGRTTASHQIAAKTGNVIMKARKGKTKGEKRRSEPEAYNASDEDDSLEREAALLSPVKGIAARKANKVSNQYLTSVINFDAL
jgi:hypothetical protein